MYFPLNGTNSPWLPNHFYNASVFYGATCHHVYTNFKIGGFLIGVCVCMVDVTGKPCNPSLSLVF